MVSLGLQHGHETEPGPRDAGHGGGRHLPVGRQELVACGTITSPSCTAGGNYATKIESYLRVRYEASPDTWKVTAKDGTLSTLSRLATGTTGTPKWGLASVADTNGNTVTYSWACIVGEDCFPSSVSYNGATVTFFRETRPDLMSFADTNQLGDIKYRLKSVVVKLGSSAIRGYKLAYSISPVTLRSLLASVQTYGKDVAYSSTTGEITGGTSLPPQVFTYSNDALGRTFQSSTFGAATAATTEAVVWVKTTNTTPAGSTLTKTGGTDGLWDAGAISNRGIMFGDGSLDFTASVGSKHRMVGLSNGNTGVSTSDIDFALEQAPSSGLKIFGLFAFPSG